MAKVGFGDEYSRRHVTHTMNAHVKVETRPVAGGADVVVTPRRGYAIMPEVDVDTGEVTIRVRKDTGPRIGETLMVGRRHVVVADRRWTSKGTLQVMDGDTGAWLEVAQR